MACNTNKIENFEARLKKIAKLKAALEERMQTSKEVDNSVISISNAQYENKVDIVEGKVRRSVVVQGDEIIPVKNNPNTINNVLDGLDSNSLNTPKILPGDFVEVKFIENDYWANNKDNVEEAWMEAPLYLVDKDGVRVDLLESFNENKIDTHSRKAIYDALQEGPVVTNTTSSTVSVEDVVGPNTFTHKTPNLKGILNWLKAGKVIGRNESIENFKKEGSQGVFNTDKSNSNVPNFQKGEFYIKNPTSGYAVITNQSEDNFIPNANGVNENSFEDSRGVGILKPTEQARNLNNFDIYKVNKDGSLSKIDTKALAAQQTNEVKEVAPMFEIIDESFI